MTRARVHRIPYAHLLVNCISGGFHGGMEAGDNNMSQYKPLQCALGRFDGTKSPQKPSARETVPESQLLTVRLISWLSQPLTLTRQRGSFSWVAVKANKRKSCQDKLSGRTCWNSISRTWNAYGPGWHQGVTLAGSQYPHSNRLQPLTSHDLGRCTVQHISNYPHLHFTFAPWPRLLYIGIWKKEKKINKAEYIQGHCQSWSVNSSWVGIKGTVTHFELMLKIFFFTLFILMCMC